MIEIEQKQIVCISTQYWDEAWFRKQQFMHRFIEDGYSIAYVEPTFSIYRKPHENKKDFAKNIPFRALHKQISEKLHLIKPPLAFPLWYYPVFGGFNYFYASSLINRLLDLIGFKDYILISYIPQYAALRKRFKCKSVVFDLTDDLAAFYKNNPIQYGYINRSTINAVKQADYFIATSKVLFNNFNRFFKGHSSGLVSNGFDSGMFNLQDKPLPKEFIAVRKPIIGFVGTIFPYLDFELLKFLVKRNPDKTFVFIGGCEGNVQSVWKDIIGFNNVIWLNRRPKEEIPGFIHSFDVCLNPFLVDDVAKSVNPLKIYEYLACGKSVISTKMESLLEEPIARFINFVDSYEGFQEKLNNVLKEKFVPSESDYKIIREYSWDNLFNKFRDIII